MFANPAIPPIARRAHSKSRRGCKECKSRKVKCDEKHPLCENCHRRYGDIGKCEFEGLDAAGGRSESKSTSSLMPLTLMRIEAKPEGPKIDLGLVKAGAAELQALRGASSPATPPGRTIGAERLDPFATHPESRLIDADLLMKYSVMFQTFPWQPKSEKNPVTKYYAPLIWNDSVMFHATLQLSAARLEHRVSGKNVEPRRLMGECIRLLNNRVRDPLLNVSDQTIAAVAILATVEYERGNMKMFNMHLSGLKQMLNLRGGLAAIRKSSPMVANMVFWTSVVALTETTNLQLDPSDTLETPQWLHDARASYGHTSHLKLEAFGVDKTLAGIMFDVKYLSQRFIRHTDYISVDECLSALTFVCNTLQRVLGMRFTPVSNLSPTSPSSSISEACRLAVALHIMTPWRGLRPDPTLVISDQLHRLRTCLSPLIVSGSSNELLLWLLFTGGVSALGTPERAWFTKHLVTIVVDLELDRWQDVRSCLVKVIWHEILCERSYRELWGEVKAWKDDLEILAL